MSFISDLKNIQKTALKLATDHKLTKAEVLTRIFEGSGINYAGTTYTTANKNDAGGQVIQKIIKGLSDERFFTKTLNTGNTKKIDLCDNGSGNDSNDAITWLVENNSSFQIDGDMCYTIPDKYDGSGNALDSLTPNKYYVCKCNYDNIRLKPNVTESIGDEYKIPGDITKEPDCAKIC